MRGNKTLLQLHVIAIRLSFLEFCFVSFCGFSYAPIVDSNKKKIRYQVEKKLDFPPWHLHNDKKKPPNFYVYMLSAENKYIYIHPNIEIAVFSVVPTKRVILYTFDIRMKLEYRKPKNKKREIGKKSDQLYIISAVCRAHNDCVDHLRFESRKKRKPKMTYSVVLL